MGFPRNVPAEFKRRILILRVMKADAEEVEEVLLAGGDPNSCTRKGTPALIRLVRNHLVMSDVVAVLLRYGADPAGRDPAGFTALHYARRRLARFEGRPRPAPRRSPSLTPGNELRLSEREWRFIERLDASHPGAGDQYLAGRRKAAERVIDNRSNLERIVAMLAERER